jgi:hypothetical protein
MAVCVCSGFGSRGHTLATCAGAQPNPGVWVRVTRDTGIINAGSGLVVAVRQYTTFAKQGMLIGCLQYTKQLRQQLCADANGTPTFSAGKFDLFHMWYTVAFVQLWLSGARTCM